MVEPHRPCFFGRPQNKRGFSSWRYTARGDPNEKFSEFHGEQQIHQALCGRMDAKTVIGTCSLALLSKTLWATTSCVPGGAFLSSGITGARSSQPCSRAFDRDASDSSWFTRVRRHRNQVTKYRWRFWSATKTTLPLARIQRDGQNVDRRMKRPRDGGDSRPRLTKDPSFPRMFALRASMQPKGRGDRSATPIENGAARSGRPVYLGKEGEKERAGRALGHGEFTQARVRRPPAGSRDRAWVSSARLEGTSRRYRLLSNWSCLIGSLTAEGTAGGSGCRACP